jgi:hypothetical protein
MEHGAWGRYGMRDAGREKAWGREQRRGVRCQVSGAAGGREHPPSSPTGNYGGQVEQGAGSREHGIAIFFYF